MVGKNVINRAMQNSPTTQLQSDMYSKSSCNDEFNRSLNWFSLDAKYTDNEIMKFVMEDKYELITYLL